MHTQFIRNNAQYIVVISNVFIFIRMYNPALNYLLNAETKIGSLELPNLGSITSRSEILS
jgi:hypothetical protein